MNGTSGKAALADPTEQPSSWLAVNRPVNSGAYVLTLGLREAKIALTARADGVGARRQHMMCPPDFACGFPLKFVFLVHNRKDNTHIKVE